MAPYVSKEEYDAVAQTVGVALCRDLSIPFSGRPINNSASLEVQIKHDIGVNVAYHTALDYTANARCFLTNVQVRL
jgi:hypothetical protein